MVNEGIRRIGIRRHEGALIRRVGIRRHGGKKNLTRNATREAMGPIVGTRRGRV